jgi:hypothetical protein
MVVASIALVNLLFVQIECIAAAAMTFAVYKFALFVHGFTHVQKISPTIPTTAIQAIKPLTVEVISS